MLWTTTWSNYMLMISSIPESDSESSSDNAGKANFKEMDVVNWC